MMNSQNMIFYVSQFVYIVGNKKMLTLLEAYETTVCTSSGLFVCMYVCIVLCVAYSVNSSYMF